MLSRRFIAVGGFLLAVAAHLPAAEVVELDEANWEAYIPAGKEVDAIYGDYVLRSDRLIAIVGRALETRHANMKVKNVGGALIDFTRRDVQSDQLTCFYPHGEAYELQGPVAWPEALVPVDGACRIAFRAMPMKDSRAAAAANLEIIVGYELVDGDDYLVVRSLIRNPTSEPVELELTDGVCADGEFKFGHESRLNLWWCYDEFWRQAYGIQPADDDFVIHVEDRDGRRLDRLRYVSAGGDNSLVIKPGKSLMLQRRIFAAADTVAIQAVARRLRGEKLVQATITLTDPAGPVAGALIRIKSGDNTIGSARTDRAGALAAELPPSDFRCCVTAQGRDEQTFEISPSAA